MKKILTILVVLFISKFGFAQTEAYKFADFEVNGQGCDNYFRYADFTQEIAKNDSNKGLVVIYTGDTKDRFGNILGYVKSSIWGIEDWLKFPKDKISIIILEGRKFFAQEFWIIPKNAKSPYAGSYKFDWSKIESKYYFSTTCLQCEPSYPMWTDYQPNFVEFARILKQYPSYKGEILLNNYGELKIVKERLTKDEKLPRNRYSIKFRKKIKGEENYLSIDLYLIPEKNKKNLSAKL